MAMQVVVHYQAPMSERTYCGRLGQTLATTPTLQDVVCKLCLAAWRKAFTRAH